MLDGLIPFALQCVTIGEVNVEYLVRDIERVVHQTILVQLNRLVYVAGCLSQFGFEKTVEQTLGIISRINPKDIVIQSISDKISYLGKSTESSLQNLLAERAMFGAETDVGLNNDPVVKKNHFGCQTTDTSLDLEGSPLKLFEGTTSDSFVAKKVNDFEQLWWRMTDEQVLYSVGQTDAGVEVVFGHITLPSGPSLPYEPTLACD